LGLYHSGRGLVDQGGAAKAFAPQFTDSAAGFVAFYKITQEKAGLPVTIRRSGKGIRVPAGDHAGRPDSRRMTGRIGMVSSLLGGIKKSFLLEDNNQKTIKMVYGLERNGIPYTIGLNEGAFYNLWGRLLYD
jgi:hypothetical protein